jgi:leader peptidase (prepilin peptidase) / N-methyltransferase
MTWPWVIGLAAAGVAAGPFLRAVIFGSGTPRGDPRRCHCPACGRLILGTGRPARVHLPASGRCRFCRSRIGPPLLTVELLTAAVLAVLAVKATSVWELAALGWLAVVAIPLAFIDVAVRRLPDPLTAAAYVGTVCLLVAAALATHHPGQLGRAVLAGAGLASLYLIMLFVSPASIGPGDGKLAASVGTALGWLGWGALVTGALACFMAAALFAVGLLALRRARLSDHIAFGPFILLGALAAIAIAV